MKFKKKLFFALTFFMPILANGQTDSLVKLSINDIPGITVFYNTLGLDIGEISSVLIKHHFLLADTAAQRKANQTCCPNINYKEKKFFSKYYSNGQTDVQLIFRNDNKKAARKYK